MYKLITKNGEQVFVKYYKNEKLALLRQSKKFSLEPAGETEFLSQSSNKRPVEAKYEVLLGSISIPVATEGDMNVLVERLGKTHKNVYGKKL